MTLKNLIQQIFKKHNLDTNIHFDIWICGVDKNEAIDKVNPFDCCHFLGYKKSECADDIFKWLEFEVEVHLFEMTEQPECWLFVKLEGINKPFL